MSVQLSADLADDRYGVARAALSTIPIAVVLVGAADGALRSCATGTAMYVSFEPARIAIALHPGSRTCRHVEASGEFSVSVLRADQLDVAAVAGRGASGDDKFAALGLPVAPAPDGLAAPGLRGAAAILWCRTVERVAVGDHILFVGDVVAFDAGDETVTPLVRHRRRYAELGEALTDPAPEGYPT